MDDPIWTRSYPPGVKWDAPIATSVKPGVHVGLYLPNTPHYTVAFFGVLKAGGTPTPTPTLPLPGGGSEEQELI